MKFYRCTAIACTAFLCGISSGGAPSVAQAKAQRVLVVGDSMMRIPAHSLRRELDKNANIEIKTFTSLGSGLARLDAFDWIAKLEELSTEFQPDAVVAWFGANDRQPLKTENATLAPGTPAWDEEYARRLGLAMDLLTKRAESRLYWLELPAMRESRLHEDVQAINKLARRECERRERVEFVETATWLGLRPDAFSPYVLNERGMPLQVRDNDGIHLNRAGADIVARRLRALLAPGANGDLTP